ncbi:sigma-70 family RNA polymerase sigma factor [candidate division KSB1 bacterium]|nr:sigma-70 family RNA polymerase sigma factor [candidate division KSB1 bacterium]RQW04179.1 MAG: sigma-70 family RNA polymerase sigma factor [candidate division KSB1 bacterium]
MDTEEKQLIKQILDGDTRAFKIFIETYRRLVAHIVFRMVANSADREDVCQDVFVKAYQNLHGFQFQSKISTWLARIACNTCLNYLEKRRLPLFDDRALEEMNFVSHNDDPYTEAADSDINRLLRHYIDALPVLFRAIVTLYHLDGMKYEEISQILEIPAGTVKSYLFRARRMLREKLVELEQEVLC